MKTRITELLGIEYPIVQGAMAWVSLPPLVAAVSNAGGLGILGAGGMSPEQLEENIARVKTLTDKPFGVNLLPDNPALEELLDVILAEKVRVVSYGIGNPQRIIGRTKPRGIINMPTMGSVRHSLRAERDGADAIVVQGTEAGGHCSYVGTMVLIPLVVDRVEIPVVAAGGIGDARGFAAALTLGAEGVSMGSRFIATRESPVPENMKQLILHASEEETVVTGHISGVRCRVYTNKLSQGFLDLEQKKASREEMMMYGIGKVRQAYVEGDEEMGSVALGQVCGLINDIPTCKELIERIVQGVEGILEKAKKAVKSV